MACTRREYARRGETERCCSKLETEADSAASILDKYVYDIDEKQEDNFFKTFGYSVFATY